MSMVPLGEFMPSRIPSVNPAKHPDEVFELWSIPAFDEGEPEVVPGSAIGSSKKCVEPGDVLLSRIVPHIRRSWVVSPKTENRQIASGEWITFRSDAFDGRYMRHMLTSDPFHVEFMKTVAGVGGSLLRARPEGVKQIKIPLPPLEEQRRIAGILDQADALRRLRTRALDKLNTLGQAIFHEMSNELSFGDEAGFDDIADLQVGHPFKSKNYVETDDGIRLCRGANVLPERIDWSNVARYPEELLGDLKEFELKQGDVVLAMDRPWISSGFKAAFLQEKDLPCYLVQRVARFRAKRLEDQAFLNQLVSSSSFQKHCRPTETTIPHISPREIREFRFPLPNPEMRELFGRRINQLAEVKQRATVHLGKAEALFSSLQHRAFQGAL